MDLYQKAYNKAKEMLTDSDDVNLQQLITNIVDNHDYETLHDRLADIYVQGQIDIIGSVKNWLMVNTNLDVEKIVDLQEYFTNNKSKDNE